MAASLHRTRQTGGGFRPPLFLMCLPEERGRLDVETKFSMGWVALNGPSIEDFAGLAWPSGRVRIRQYCIVVVVEEDTK